MKQWILGLAIIFSSGAMADEPRELTFGIVPQQAASKLAESWGPILLHLEAQTGHKLKFVTAPSIPEFEQRCAAGEYDFAYMNPYHYTAFSQKPGYRAFAHQANKKIQGIVVVHKDSPISRLEQLDGKDLAFPAPAAFAASVLPRAHFENNQIAIKPNFVFSHDAVYKAVAEGKFAAGGGIQRTFDTLDPAVAGRLKVLWTTDNFTPHAFAAHPRVDQEVVADVQKAMVDLKGSDAGKNLLKPIGFSAVEAADDASWNDVRSLNIDLLDRLVKG